MLDRPLTKSELEDVEMIQQGIVNHESDIGEE